MDEAIILAAPTVDSVLIMLMMGSAKKADAEL